MAGAAPEHRRQPEPRKPARKKAVEAG
jgi:hypothetical protein